MKAMRVNRACGFCGKREWQTQYLIEGESAFICDSCVHEGHALLAQQRSAGLDGDGPPLLLGPPRNRFAYKLLRVHFAALQPHEIVTATRTFPARMRADLQAALDAYVADQGLASFHGVHARYSFETLSFSSLLQEDHQPVAIAPARFEELDVGEDRPVRCLENGLWLIHAGGLPYALYLTGQYEHGQKSGVQVEIAVPAGEAGETLSHGIFGAMEEAVKQARTYRGKVLSLETAAHYSGQASGVTVHRIEPVARDDIILAAGTLDLLERNLIGFVRRRPQLARLGLPVKKGLLFYGPPGTGKTYTVRYLAGALPDHTTLLITAEQMGLLREYISLARLLQPSIVVIEDEDLIARERTAMSGPCEESLLNRLLNEMDGLREDAEIILILTTNRPAALEPAIANRPGRIDQAIEFPLPEHAERVELARIYARGLDVSSEVLDVVAQRTERCSAAFIKELLRRAAPYQAEAPGGAAERLSAAAVEQALQEMLFGAGRLNVSLLGGDLARAPSGLVQEE
jgi:hypothetical protein